MSTTPARQPAGVPTGGQFAAKSNPECDVDLEDATGRPLPSSSLSGTLAGDPNIRYVRDGFRYARDGETSEFLAHTTIDVTNPEDGSTQVIHCDGMLAESVAISLYSGTPVVACGEVDSDGRFAATDVGVSMRDHVVSIHPIRGEHLPGADSDLLAAQQWSAEMTPGPRTMSGVLQWDPEIRYDRSGVAHTTMRLVDPKTREWLLVSTSGSMAENVALSVMKGNQVVVRGSVVESEEDGVPVFSFDAEDVGASMASATVDLDPKRWS